MADTHPLADGQTKISPWMPEQDQVRLAAIGKLAEESAELAARAARCIIQGGVDEIDPDTGRTNLDEIEREMADVEAAIAAVRIEVRARHRPERVANKLSGFMHWFDLIRGIRAQPEETFEVFHLSPQEAAEANVPGPGWYFALLDGGCRTSPWNGPFTSHMGASDAALSVTRAAHDG